ncbi:DUF2268 domain-containing putative Zn-dependent protease [Bacillus sp. BHET2]|uniref:DUF2268 domain-containing putative Zn-dependent protease n=1 Tax=Bacillus sp. BHET2 TaxID=2583818 RepID=UPI001F0E2BA2|nr:DUF2268 domain-containing putative Zn-dependent protease [Bacillus sp. BHET2]
MKKKARILVVACILLLTLIACENTVQTRKEQKENQDKIKLENLVTSFEHQKTSQSFKIVHAYELFQNYISRVAKSKNPDDSYLKIYQEEVIDPIYSDCFKDGEFLHMAEPILNASPKQLNVGPSHLIEIQHVIDQIDRQKTDELIKESLIKSSDLLPSGIETTVCVLPSKNKHTDMITVGAGKINVLYNPLYTEDTLRAGVAHEYHHSISAEKHVRKKTNPTVLDNIIFEGKAVMFEKTVYPDIEFTKIDQSYNKENWAKIEPDLSKVDFNRSLEILMGGNDLPWIYGYSEGYKMVRSYVEENPGVGPAEWTGISAQEIFEKGHYLEKYQ